MEKINELNIDFNKGSLTISTPSDIIECTDVDTEKLILMATSLLYRLLKPSSEN